MLTVLTRFWLLFKVVCGRFLTKAFSIGHCRIIIKIGFPLS